MIYDTCEIAKINNLEEFLKIVITIKNLYYKCGKCHIKKLKIFFVSYS